MAESGNSPKNSTNGMPNWLRGPVLWVVLTGILAGAAAVLHMSGPAYSVHALTVTGLALAALVFLAWTLGASGADDPAGTLRPLLTAALDNALARRLDTFCEATDTREAALISALLISFLDAWEHEEAGAACSGSALSRELLELVREEIRSMKNNTNQGG